MAIASSCVSSSRGLCKHRTKFHLTKIYLVTVSQGPSAANVWPTLKWPCPRLVSHCCCKDWRPKLLLGITWFLILARLSGSLFLIVCFVQWVKREGFFICYWDLFDELTAGQVGERVPFYTCRFTRLSWQAETCQVLAEGQDCQVLGTKRQVHAKLPRAR